MRNHAFLAPAVLGATLLLGACTSSNSTISDASITVDNQSDFAIVEIRLTDVNSSSWGPNLLRGGVLYPGETLTLGVSCGTYDALLVDEAGVDCQVNNIDLCLNNADWIIRNNTCSVFGIAAKERAAQAAAASATSTAN